MHRAMGVPEPIRQLGAIPFGWSGGPLVSWRGAAGFWRGIRGLVTVWLRRRRPFCSPFAGHTTGPVQPAGARQRVAGFEMLWPVGLIRRCGRWTTKINELAALLCLTALTPAGLIRAPPLRRPG